MSGKLKAGDYYGKVSNRRQISSSVLLEVVHPQRVDLPKHSHELGFFSFLLDGSYSEIYGTKSFSYRPLTIWWHRPGILHKDEIGSTGGHFFNLEIRPEYLEKLQEIIKIPEDFYAQNNSLVWLACRLYHEFKNWENSSELVAEGITLEMLGHSAREQFREKKRPPIWFLRVVERLNDEFASNFVIEQLAMEANVHPVHLAKVFRQFQHQTIGEYQQKLRVSRAIEMLQNREIRLSEIAASVGFFDQSHFTRIFKRHLGITPAVFRQSLV